MARSIIYIDGFNLYYGAMRGGPHKWLNIESYFTRLRQADEIQRIYYFSAQVDGAAQLRQETYLRALGTLPLVTVVLGKYKYKQVKCSVQACAHNQSKVFRVPEEKRTDVNIATQMLDDAYQDSCDVLILVSGDSDIVPSLNRVKIRFPNKKIIVYVPSRDPVRGAAVELRAAADSDRNLPLDLIKRSQFPAQIPDGAGGFIFKPPTW